jgi:hypothetical protein
MPQLDCSVRRVLEKTVLALVLCASSWALESARAQAPTAGYDKGFFIKSDNFEIHVGTRTQLQFSSTEPDTFMFDSVLGAQDETANDNELSVRRFKFFMSGFAWKPSVKWKIQLDVERFKPGGGSAGNVRLEEAFVDLTQKPWWQLRIGQFKVPFGYEKMTSSGKLNLVDRSIVHTLFGIDQEPGINLYGQSFDKKFRYDVAITTGVADNKGFDTTNDLDINGESDFRYMARVTLEPLAPYVWEQGAVSTPDKPQLTLQLGLMSNKSTVPQAADRFMPTDLILPFGRAVLGANSPTYDAVTETFLNQWKDPTLPQTRKAYDRNEVEFVGAFKYQRAYVETQAIIGTVEPELKYLKAHNAELADVTFDNTGFRVQAGVFVVPAKIEIAGRWCATDREATAKFQTNPSIKQEIEQTEYRLGFNWYFSKHDWKWQIDAGQIGTEWKLNDTALVVPDGPTNPDKVIQNNERKDKEIRTQFQFQF